MKNLLNVVASWSEYFNVFLGMDQSSGTYQVLKQVFDILSIVLWVVLGLVGAVGAVYAIYLGVQLARAEDQGKRDDAKKHLITVFIAIGVTIALILVFNIFLPMLLSAFIDKDKVGFDSSETVQMIRPLLNLLGA